MANMKIEPTHRCFSLSRTGKQIQLWNTDSNRNGTTLGSLYYNHWQEITGKPDSSSWLERLRKYVSYGKREHWSTPFDTLVNLDLKHIAHLKKKGKIGDVFMFVDDPEEKRAVALFLAGKGIDKGSLETLFYPGVLQLDQNEEPEPARERDFDLNQRPRLELDLNQTPPAEQVEPDDGGGGGD